MPQQLTRALVDTDWAAAHLDDPGVCFVEIGMTPDDYEQGHIPGAVFWNASTDLLFADYRINFDPEQGRRLLARSGISPETTMVCYGNHATAGAWLFWMLSVFGHERLLVLDGGRRKWLAEGRRLTAAIPERDPIVRDAIRTNADIRAMFDDVTSAIATPGHILLDARSPEEYRGECFFTAPPQGDERAGHIPGAVNVGYEATLGPDGTFKSPEDLNALMGSYGITADKEIITYCAIGARSSHLWFTLKHVLGYPNVRNYDGSWNEWSRRGPVEA